MVDDLAPLAERSSAHLKEVVRIEQFRNFALVGLYQQLESFVH